MTQRHHHDGPPEVIARRIAAVVDRLDVALQFSTVDTAVIAQALHAFEFALNGPPCRTDDDWLRVDASEALKLVRALLPFVAAARDRPGFEYCAEHDEPKRQDA